jgi:predicted nicotinamide N-methyase
MDMAGIKRARPLDRFVETQTEIVRVPFISEIALRLARDPRGIFQAAEQLVDGGLEHRPYWAFAWPGGQGLARYILDNPDVVRGKRVLDVGSGSALGAIAALKAGAQSALAADVDPLACAAARANAKINGVALDVTAHDLLGRKPDADVILIGDLAYEPELVLRVGAFIAAAQKAGIPVFYGDRTSARRPRAAFKLLVEYEAPLVPMLVEDFIEWARVWKL